MATMDDQEFQAIVRNEVESSLGYQDSQYSEHRLKALDYYYGEAFGNEVEGRSQVVATEVSDTIEFIMPTLMRMFASASDYCQFVPRNKEDIPLAEQATDYVNYIISQDNNGFQVFHDWFKDGLLSKLGVVKVYWEDKTEVTHEDYEGLTEDELTQIVDDDAVEVVEQSSRPYEEFEAPVDPRTGEPLDVEPPMLYDVRVKRASENGRVRIENVPPEEFLVNKWAKSLEDAYLVAHQTPTPVSDLVARGYDRDEMENLAGYTGEEFNDEKQNRFQQLDASTEDDRMDPTMQQVLETEAYIYADYDGDGIAELRRVVMLGQGYEIYENEPWDHIPFAVLSPILMPHRLVGRSYAELVMDLQKIKSTVLRQLLDNMYQMNNSRMEAVEGQVNLDDLTTNRPGGVVRTKAPGMVNPLTPPSIQKESYPLLEYLDEIKTQRTGFSRASMGMDADALQSTTQKAVEASMQNAQDKIELVARVYAETGVKRLFRLILALVNKYQNFERMIRLRGGYQSMDPREWHTQFDMQINVGLGNGRDEQKMAMLQQIRQDQKEVLFNMGPQNPIVSSAQYAASGRKMAELVGFKDTDIFYTEPRQVYQQEKAMAQQPQQSPEMLEHQRKMQEMQLEHERKVQEQEQDLARQRQEFQQEMSLKFQQAQANIELERQKAAAQYQMDIEKLRQQTRIDEMEAEAYQEQVRQSGDNGGNE
jgi:hypothetical protein